MDTKNLLCESCFDNGIRTKAVKLVPSSENPTDHGFYYVPVCKSHALGWWDGCDWDGRHLEKDIKNAKTSRTV